MPGLASLLRGRTTNPRAAARRKPLRFPTTMEPYPMGQNPRMTPYDPANQPVVPRPVGPPGGKTGGVVGYQRGGRTVNPRAAGAAKRRELLRRKYQNQVPFPMGQNPYESPYDPANPPRPGGWQEGGPVGVSPEEVDMASDIYARAAPEQQAQITGGGGGPGMMDEEAAIGEALAMAMGGGGGGPPMNGGPPMGGMI